MLSKKVIVAAFTTVALVWPTTAPARPADHVPPPPSSIAVSAADEYEELRAAGGTDGVQDLRSPDMQDRAAGHVPTLPDIGEDTASGGFDVVSGALGAAAGIVLAVTAVALAGGLASVRPRRHHVARS